MNKSETLAKTFLQANGFSVTDAKWGSGYDFLASKSDIEYHVEVKKGTGTFTLTKNEFKNLLDDQNFFIVVNCKGKMLILMKKDLRLYSPLFQCVFNMS